MAHVISAGIGPEAFTLSGEFDLASSTSLVSAFAGGQGVFELHASAVEFIDSVGLRGIVEAAGSRGAVFVKPSPIVMRFLALLDRTGQPAGIACR